MSISQMLPEALAAKYREFLKPFEGHTQAILDSRIVDHNLDVANPPNGHYVRWESGLQVCWHHFVSELGADVSVGALFRSDPLTWIFPAEFVDGPARGGSFNRGGSAGYISSTNASQADPTAWEYYLVNPQSLSSDTTRVILLAMGRWSA